MRIETPVIMEEAKSKDINYQIKAQKMDDNSA